ncbi:MAG: hypothetical protein R3359_02950, partial [Marinirhabdus sp.]|nr:hypothetical protein [Marinirhabdus sp.]
HSPAPIAIGVSGRVFRCIRQSAWRDAAATPNAYECARTATYALGIEPRYRVPVKACLPAGRPDRALGVVTPN